MKYLIFLQIVWGYCCLDVVYIFKGNVFFVIVYIYG